MLQQPALTQLMEVGNGDTSHIGDRILAFNFTWKLIPTNWVCPLVPSAIHSLKSSNGGKKDVEAGVMPSSSATMASVPVSLGVAVSHPERAGLPPQKLEGHPSFNSQCCLSLSHVPIVKYSL